MNRAADVDVFRSAVLVAALTGLVVAIVLPSRTTGMRQAAGPRRSVWDGAYTDAQAERGKVVYDNACSVCHGDELEGAEEARSPALKGPRFALTWDRKTVGDLFTRVKDTMPQNAPGSLERSAYIDLVAFLLRANAFPAGAAELPGELPALSQIDIAMTKSPSP